jgi:hypothetical protein
MWSGLRPLGARSLRVASATPRHDLNASFQGCPAFAPWALGRCEWLQPLEGKFFKLLAPWANPVSPSLVSRAQDYVHRQKEHHPRQTYERELIELYRLHDKEYVAEYVLD